MQRASAGEASARPRATDAAISRKLHPCVSRTLLHVCHACALLVVQWCCCEQQCAVASLRVTALQLKSLSLSPQQCPTDSSGNSGIDSNSAEDDSNHLLTRAVTSGNSVELLSLSLQQRVAAHTHTCGSR